MTEEEFAERGSSIKAKTILSPLSELHCNFERKNKTKIIDTVDGYFKTSMLN